MTDDATQEEMSDPFTILDAPDAGQYELHDGDTTIGFAQYLDQDDSRVFMHTVVDGAYEGQGLGSRLARFVLEDAVEHGKRIVPLCPFIAAYLRRHHEYDAHVDWQDTATD